MTKSVSLAANRVASSTCFNVHLQIEKIWDYQKNKTTTLVLMNEFHTADI